MAAHKAPVILRLNIGENHHQWVTDADIDALVDHPNPIVLNLEREFDRETFTPRQWRALARDLDRLVDAATGAARYVVMGRAPLPVFAYLGARMVRMANVTFANDLQGKWELFSSPKDCPTSHSRNFEVRPPELGRGRDGRFALSVLCSGEYRTHESSIETLVEAEGAEFLGPYEIQHSSSHRTQPLGPGDLRTLIDEVERALRWFADKAPHTDSLMVPIAGPAWVAFWIGHRLVPTVCGRFDLPNFVPGPGYRRALSYPMDKAPYLAGRAKLQLMYAEPKDLSRTRAAKGLDVIQDALERELGADGPYDIRRRGAARIREFMRDIETFEPDILHLHLHGGETGDLAFEDESGEMAVFAADRFVDMLRATRVRPTLIVLNACHSKALAPALLGIAECVVAMEGEALVDGVIEFSRYFYEALGRGGDLARAIDQGTHGTNIGNVKVYTEGDLDTEKVVLLPRPRRKS